MTVELLLRQAEALTPDERRELAARLLETDVENDPPLTRAQKAELDRRIAYSDVNPGSGIPWEVVKAKSLERLRRKSS
ncbi:MAG TPA: addiction module protein [Urbifossiella sp.]|nr:addiction module protein [Urbifossiella sp.]